MKGFGALNWKLCLLIYLILFLIVFNRDSRVQYLSDICTPLKYTQKQSACVSCLLERAVIGLG